jgi:hypothetical protein
VPVWPSTVVSRIEGRGRLAGVELTGTRTGRSRFVACDLVVFTGDWIPDHELARAGCLAMDPGTRGPRVDAALETSVPGVFAAGNLVHAAETADVAALGGRHAARGIAAMLARGPARQPVRLPVTVEPPLLWIAPNALRVAPCPRSAGDPPRLPAMPPPRGFILRSEVFRRVARIDVIQDGARLASQAAYGIVPDRPVHLRAPWTRGVNPAGGPIVVRLR